MTSTALDHAARFGLTTAHEALAAVRGTPAVDAAIDAVMQAEDAALAAPQDCMAAVVLRASIALRRLRVASEDPDAQEWAILGSAIDDIAGAEDEATGAIAELVRVALAHRSAILAGNAMRGRRSALDPAREDEVQAIEQAIAKGQAILRAAGAQA